MSLVFGLSLSNMGMLLSDTQLNFSLKDGAEVVDESEPFQISLGGIGNVAWGRDFRKLVQLPIGYVAATGDAILSRKALDRLAASEQSSLEKSRSIIKETAKEIRNPLFQQLPGSAERYDRTTFLFLLPGPDKVELSVISSLGEIESTGQEYCASWPPDLKSGEAESLMQGLSQLVVPTSLLEACENIAVLAHLAALVHQRSGKVGSRMELGMCIVDNGTAHQWYLTGVSSVLASMSSPDILAQMSQRVAVRY